MSDAPRRTRWQRRGKSWRHGTTIQRRPGREESLGEQLIREGREGQAEFRAGWGKFMEELGIQGEPMGAKKLRATLLQSGINPNDIELSRGIIGIREE